MRQAAYIKRVRRGYDPEDPDTNAYTPLKPTGVWRLSSGPYNDEFTMHVQHHSSTFGSERHVWVHEKHIVFRAAEDEFINGEMTCPKCDIPYPKTLAETTASDSTDDSSPVSTTTKTKSTSTFLKRFLRMVLRM